MNTEKITELLSMVVANQQEQIARQKEQFEYVQEIQKASNKRLRWLLLIVVVFLVVTGVELLVPLLR